jgi:predicted transcriptional regulator
MQSVVHFSNHERRPAVPILKAPPQQSKNESLQLRVSTEFKLKLQRYAEFLKASPSYVVIEALGHIFHKDHEFRAWLEQHPKTALTNANDDKSATEMTSKS